MFKSFLSNCYTNLVSFFKDIVSYHQVASPHMTSRHIRSAKAKMNQQQTSLYCLNLTSSKVKQVDKLDIDRTSNHRTIPALTKCPTATSPSSPPPGRPSVRAIATSFILYNVRCSKGRKEELRRKTLEVIQSIWFIWNDLSCPSHILPTYPIIVVCDCLCVPYSVS